MCLRYLGFVLIWLPGWLNAQSVTQSCSAPTLDGGFFAPKQEIYSHETKLTYTCDDGRKPAVKGWWAESTCENGKWSHEPQCIDENSCIPPNVPNGIFTTTQTGWYKKGATIRITCDKGYQHKNMAATAKCQNGTWSSLPVCEKSSQTCGELPKISHAVIINQGYQNVFAVNSKVTYECKDGYTTEEGNTRKETVCISGHWTGVPTCRSPSSSGSIPSFILIRNCGRPPDVPNGGVVQIGLMFLKYQCSSFYTLVGSDTVKCHSDRTWSQLPTCEGSSSSSGSSPSFLPIENCGRHPNVPNGDVVQTDRMFLKYQCSSFYTLVGSDTVVCYGDHTWSQLPSCDDAFCKLDPDQYPEYRLRHGIGVQYIKEGETKDIPCLWTNWIVRVRCINRKITLSSHCCSIYDINRGECW